MVKKSIYLAVTFLTAGLLVGCNDSDSLTNNDSYISYVNAIDEQVSFYARDDTKTSSLYSSKNLTVSLMEGEYSNSIRHKWFGLTSTKFGIQDTNSHSFSATIKELLRDDDDYWLVAWQKEQDYAVSLIKKFESSRNNVYRIRIFADQALKVFLREDSSPVLTTKRGEVSSYITVEQCTDLTVGANNIDLCTGDIGASYLVVVNDKGLVNLIKK